MRAPLLKYFLLLAGLCGTLVHVYAQQPAGEPDTLETSLIGKNAIADEVFFNAVKAKARGDDKSAQALFEEYVTKRPDVSAGYYELSKIHYKNKNISKAEDYIKKAITLDSGNKWYREQYASILADKGSFKDAADIMASLAKSEPQDPAYLLGAAEYYERAKMYNEAISCLDKAMNNGPDEDILVRKMQVYLSLNDVDKAAASVEELIKLDPRNGKYYKLLGEIYDNNKLPAKAWEVYERARKLLPEDPSVELGVAEHYLRTGDSAAYITAVRKMITNSALDAEIQLSLLRSYITSLPNDSTSRDQGMPIIRQLVEQHPSDADVLGYFGVFLESAGKHDSAAATYKRSLSLKPANFTIWGKLLGVYTERQYADSLIKYSERCIRLFPNMGVVHYYNGIGHINKKEYTPAIKAINRAIDLQSSETDADKEAVAQMLTTLADVYHNNKQDDLSDKTFDRALLLTPNDATLLNNYAYYLSERGKRLDDAEKMSRKSLAIRPGEGTYLDTYGWVMYKKGDYNAAREYVQKAIDVAGSSADATLYEHLGDIYYHLNDKDKAIDNWKISKQKGGDAATLDKKISEGKLYE